MLKKIMVDEAIDIIRSCHISLEDLTKKVIEGNLNTSFIEDLRLVEFSLNQICMDVQYSSEYNIKNLQEEIDKVFGKK